MRRKHRPEWAASSICRKPSLTWLLAVSQLALAVGCSDDFTPYNRLESLRVLAIQSEPTAPAPGETSVLTPLVYAPPEAGEVEYEWRWCPLAGDPGAGFPCLIDEDELAMFGDTGLPDYDLGTDPTASFEHNLDPAILQQLCEGLPGLPFLIDCTGGFPIHITLTVRTSGDEAEELVAVRSLRLRLDDEDPPNQNPTIDALTAIVGGQGQLLDTEGTVSLPRRKETPIFAEVPQEAAEVYFGEDLDGEEGELRERLTLTWFVETGETRSMRTSFIEGEIHLYQAVENRWTPAREDEFERDESQLTVVIRDNRGGVSWHHALVSLEPES